MSWLGFIFRVIVKEYGKRVGLGVELIVVRLTRWARRLLPHFIITMWSLQQPDLRRVGGKGNENLTVFFSLSLFSFFISNQLTRLRLPISSPTLCISTPHFNKSIAYRARSKILRRRGSCVQKREIVKEMSERSIEVTVNGEERWDELFSRFPSSCKLCCCHLMFCFVFVW